MLPVGTVETKWCKLCKTDKPVGDFSIDRGRKGGRYWACKDCDRHRKRQLLYGITREEFESLVEQQEGQCGICRKDLELDKPLAISVDHDHDTQEVRGILCNLCNRILGMMGDTMEDVAAFCAGAHDYLR